jgi:tetratricopeptide (TPR) repeat protein
MTDTNRLLLAAQGYLELGMFRHGLKELELLTAEAQKSCPAMEIRALALMGLQDWKQAYLVAMRLREIAPTEPGGFIHAAYCLHELGKTEEALSMLLNGPDTLRSRSVFFYNAACYQARLGRVDAAMKMLEKSFEMDPALRTSARKDPDLEALKSRL